MRFPLHNLIPEIISEENMGESFDYVISHLEHQRQREAYRPKRLKVIESLRREIGAGSFRIVQKRDKLPYFPFHFPCPLFP